MIIMTEKRFRFVRCVSNYDWWGVIDNTGEIKGELSDCFTTNKVVDLLNNYEDENQQLKQSYQDDIDCFNNWFIRNWDNLSEELKESAHLELGIDIDYED